MYESKFGLRRRPFRSLADSDSYYAATTHEQCLARLLDAINADECLSLVTGAPGTGKTILGYCLLERLGKQVSTIFLIHSHFGDRSGLLRAILYDLDLPHAGKTEQELRLELLDFLLKNYAEGRRTVLILDEAQRLTPDLLEELRLLTNYEGDKGKTFQVIFLAQPSFLQLLKLPDLAVFDQRLLIRMELEPLGIHEAADYLVHSLRAEGGRPERIITDEALELLARHAGGVPRLLNRAADRALGIACAAEESQVDAEAVLEALNELGMAPSTEAFAGPVATEFQPRSLDATTNKHHDETVLCMKDVAEGGEEAVVVDSQRAAGLKSVLIATPRRPA